MEIIEVSKRPKLFPQAVQAFYNQWGTEDNYAFYEDCMRHSSADGLPSFYVALEGVAILGTYALLRNDLNSRHDLCPWLACLWVDPEHRGKEFGRKLLEHGLQEAEKKGYSNLYLNSDLDSYYEKYGWVHTGMLFGPFGNSNKIYEKKCR
ncbi:GNAT family N-acetyltransferase [Bacillus mangrovi]|uniref:GNAT family N-acetyltransferase n=1 Tax=Metabacillus mangrovi TaxID=1491830 RepID=A0A7X2S5C9_9BACI|nr:GNAT family N-acetyltransferase [Metabacillus mangrovi]MTH53545.1 GNAT family N-acetyltransferase [Metabacillus mangrovi]